VLRYYALATLIVAGALAVMLALPRRPAGPGAVPHYHTGGGTPGPSARDLAHAGPPTVSGNAPWALSALPSCFRQRLSARGPAAFARKRIPPGARLVAAGSTLRVADCTLEVRADWAVVTRGENRLVIPAVARLYVAGARLILDRSEGPRDDVRVYVLRGGGLPAFVPAPPAKP
jgi:hypothetical protein